jgi:hypothetical protein
MGQDAAWPVRVKVYWIKHAADRPIGHLPYENLEMTLSERLD